MFIVGPGHTFEQFAEAINTAFARWDRSHLHQFGLADGRVIGCPDDTYAPELVWLEHAKLKVTREVKPDDQFEYIFDLGDNWQHRCTVASTKADPSMSTGSCPPDQCQSGAGDGSPINTDAAQNTPTTTNTHPAPTPSQGLTRRHFAALAYGSVREEPSHPQPSSGLVFNRREWPSFQPTLTIRGQSLGCARWVGGSVHGCKSVGRDTVGAGIDFAVSCQHGDFLTDSLGG